MKNEERIKKGSYVYYMDIIRLFFNILIFICCCIVEDFITRGPLSIRVIILTLLNGVVSCLLININYKVCAFVDSKRKGKEK